MPLPRVSDFQAISSSWPWAKLFSYAGVSLIWWATGSSGGWRLCFVKALKSAGGGSGFLIIPQLFLCHVLNITAPYPTSVLNTHLKRKKGSWFCVSSWCWEQSKGRMRDSQGNVAHLCCPPMFLLIFYSLYAFCLSCHFQSFPSYTCTEKGELWWAGTQLILQFRQGDAWL